MSKMAPFQRILPIGMKQFLIICLLVSTVQARKRFKLFRGYASSSDTCTKCDTRDLADCVSTNPVPADGGDPCFCVPNAWLPGCVLKPCVLTATGDPCDITGYYVANGFQDQTPKYQYPCRSRSSGCETCKSVPPDCNRDSLFSNPPAMGGPDCACSNAATPAGCTLKPCSKENAGPAPCICTEGVNATMCYTGRCPGNGGRSGGGSVFVGLPAMVIVGIVTARATWAMIG